jgi:hypothetical protein
MNCIYWSIIIVMTCHPACKSGLPAAQHTSRDEVRFARSAIRGAGALHRRSRLCMADEGVAYRWRGCCRRNTGPASKPADPLQPCESGMTARSRPSWVAFVSRTTGG